MSIEVVETIRYYPISIELGENVVDYGANVGRFSSEIIRRFDCLCYAVEPAPDTFSKIPITANLHRYNFALCTTNKLVTMSIDDDITRSATALGGLLAYKVAGRTVDLLKMD
jgi:hypothetical protein